MALAVVSRGFLDVPNSATAKKPKWRQKYFVAVKGFLLVYAKQPDPGKKSVPKAKLDLRGASVFEKQNYAPRHHVIGVRDRKGKEHLFGAIDREEVARWIKAIKNAMDPNFDPSKVDASKRARPLTRGPSQNGERGGGGRGGGAAASVQQNERPPMQRRTSSLEKLPPGWEMAKDSRGRVYYIDHNTKMTTYRSPVKSGVNGGAMPAAVGRAGPTAEEANVRRQRAVEAANEHRKPAVDPKLDRWASVGNAGMPPRAASSSDPPRRASSDRVSRHHERMPDVSRGGSSPAARVRPSFRGMDRAAILADLKIDPLPSGWEVKFTAKGRPYFIDHNTRKTTFDRPPPVTAPAAQRPMQRKHVPSAPSAFAPSAPPASAPAAAAQDFDDAEFARIQERLALAAAATPSAPPVEASAPPDDDPPPARKSVGSKSNPMGGMMAQLASEASSGRDLLKKAPATEASSDSSASGASDEDNPALALPTYMEHTSRHATINLRDKDMSELKKALAHQQSESSDEDSDSSAGSLFVSSSSSASVSIGSTPASSEAEEEVEEFDTDDEQEIAADIKAKKLQVIRLKRAEQKAEAISLLREVKVMEADLRQKCEERDARRAAAKANDSPITDRWGSVADGGEASSSDDDRDDASVRSSPSATPPEPASPEDSDSGEVIPEEKVPLGGADRDERLGSLADISSAAAAGISALRKPRTKAPSPPSNADAGDGFSPKNPFSARNLLGSASPSSNEGSDSSSVPSVSSSDGEDDIPDFADPSAEEPVIPSSAKPGGTLRPKRPPPPPVDEEDGGDELPGQADQGTFTKADIERMRIEMEAQMKAEMEAKMKAEIEAKMKAEIEAQMKAEVESQMKERIKAELIASMSSGNLDA